MPEKPLPHASLVEILGAGMEIGRSGLVKKCNDLDDIVAEDHYWQNENGWHDILFEGKLASTLFVLMNTCDSLRLKPPSNKEFYLKQIFGVLGGIVGYAAAGFAQKAQFDEIDSNIAKLRSMPSGFECFYLYRRGFRVAEYDGDRLVISKIEDSF